MIKVADSFRAVRLVNGVVTPCEAVTLEDYRQLLMAYQELQRLRDHHGHQEQRERTG